MKDESHNQKFSKTYFRLRKRVWEILRATHRDDSLSKSVNLFIIILVVVNIIAFVLQTVDSIDRKYGSQLYVFEVFSVIIFTIEYIARLLTCSTELRFRGFRGLVRFMRTPMAVIDLLAILPFYMPFLGIDLRIVRIFRIFRVFRIFKIGRYYSSLQMIRNVFSRKKEELVMTSIIMLVMLLLSATFLYYAERDIQPDKFSSIPEAMWWAVITLTTVGYGDVVPITVWGKTCCAVIAILGVGFFALPISIVGSGFVEEIAASKQSKKCPHCGKEF
ncbi:MAG: ion transporter [Victivallaceae bacterium]